MKLYIANIWAVTKQLKRKGIENKPMVVIKWNHKIYLIPKVQKEEFFILERERVSRGEEQRKTETLKQTPRSVQSLI